MHQTLDPLAYTPRPSRTSSSSALISPPRYGFLYHLWNPRYSSIDISYSVPRTGANGNVEFSKQLPGYEQVTVSHTLAYSYLC